MWYVQMDESSLLEMIIDPMGSDKITERRYSEIRGLKMQLRSKRMMMSQQRRPRSNNSGGDYGESCVMEAKKKDDISEEVVVIDVKSCKKVK